MKTRVSKVLILALACGGISPPATGQENSRGVGEPSTRSWSHLQAVPSGSELIVSVRGSSSVHIGFLFSDAAALFVLDLTTLPLSRDQEQEVRDIAEMHAAQLISGMREEFVNGLVRMGRDGLFIADHKVAELREVIRRIDRADVAEVRLAASRPRISIVKATATGAAIGAGIGLALGVTVLGCHACVESWTGVLVLAGAGVGAAVGASVASARVARPDRDARLIYSAP